MSFQTLFGLPEADIRPTCVLTPFLYKGLISELRLSSLNKGTRFSSSNHERFTFIHTRIGAPNVGDAVLELKNTSCNKLIFFGACGLVESANGLKKGSVIIPPKAYNFESFSSLLDSHRNAAGSYDGDENLIQEYQEKLNASLAACASFGSVSLEKEFTERLKQNNIPAVDMECSAFYAAAKYIGRPAAALLYATDIINGEELFTSDPSGLLEQTTAARKKIISVLLEL